MAYIGNIMTISDYYSASDSLILEELGHRIRALRRRNNLTQIALAERTLMAVGTIKSLEAGKGKLSTLVAVLRELGALDQLDRFIPPITISPLKMADASTRLVRTARARATAGKDKNK
jgi:putative transcriptional regulator